MQLEDKLLALFGAGGGAVILEQVLANNPDPRYQVIGTLLVAIGVLLKAFVPESTTATAKLPAS